MALYQILVQESKINLHPQGHPRIGRGLKFQQHVEIEPVALHPQPPHHIAVPLFPSIANIASVDALQSIKLEVC